MVPWDQRSNYQLYTPIDLYLSAPPVPPPPPDPWAASAGQVAPDDYGYSPSPAPGGGGYPFSVPPSTWPLEFPTPQPTASTPAAPHVADPATLLFGGIERGLSILGRLSSLGMFGATAPTYGTIISESYRTGSGWKELGDLPGLLQAPPPVKRVIAEGMADIQEKLERIPRVGKFLSKVFGHIGGFLTIREVSESAANSRAIAEEARHWEERPWEFLKLLQKELGEGAKASPSVLFQSGLATGTLIPKVGWFLYPVLGKGLELVAGEGDESWRKWIRLLTTGFEDPESAKRVYGAMYGEFGRPGVAPGLVTGVLAAAQRKTPQEVGHGWAFVPTALTDWLLDPAIWAAPGAASGAQAGVGRLVKLIRGVPKTIGGKGISAEAAADFWRLLRESVKPSQRRGLVESVFGPAGERVRLHIPFSGVARRIRSLYQRIRGVAQEAPAGLVPHLVDIAGGPDEFVEFERAYRDPDVAKGFDDKRAERFARYRAAREEAASAARELDDAYETLRKAGISDDLLEEGLRDPAAAMRLASQHPDLQQTITAFFMTARRLVGEGASFDDVFRVAKNVDDYLDTQARVVETFRHPPREQPPSPVDVATVQHRRVVDALRKYSTGDISEDELRRVTDEAVRTSEDAVYQWASHSSFSRYGFAEDVDPATRASAFGEELSRLIQDPDFERAYTDLYRLSKNIEGGIVGDAARAGIRRALVEEYGFAEDQIDDELITRILRERAAYLAGERAPTEAEPRPARTKAEEVAEAVQEKAAEEAKAKAEPIRRFVEETERVAARQEQVQKRARQERVKERPEVVGVAAFAKGEEPAKEVTPAAEKRPSEEAATPAQPPAREPRLGERVTEVEQPRFEFRGYVFKSPRRDQIVDGRAMSVGTSEGRIVFEKGAPGWHSDEISPVMPSLLDPKSPTDISVGEYRAAAGMSMIDATKEVYTTRAGADAITAFYKSVADELNEASRLLKATDPAAYDEVAREFRAAEQIARVSMHNQGAAYAARNAWLLLRLERHGRPLTTAEEAVLAGVGRLAGGREGFTVGRYTIDVQTIEELEARGIADLNVVRGTKGELEQLYDDIREVRAELTHRIEGWLGRTLEIPANRSRYTRDVALYMYLTHLQHWLENLRRAPDRSVGGTLVPLLNNVPASIYRDLDRVREIAASEAALLRRALKVFPQRSIPEAWTLKFYAADGLLRVLTGRSAIGELEALMRAVTGETPPRPRALKEPPPERPKAGVEAVKKAQEKFEQYRRLYREYLLSRHVPLDASSVAALQDKARRLRAELKRARAELEEAGLAEEVEAVERYVEKAILFESGDIEHHISAWFDAISYGRSAEPLDLRDITLPNDLRQAVDAGALEIADAFIIHARRSLEVDWVDRNIAPDKIANNWSFPGFRDVTTFGTSTRSLGISFDHTFVVPTQRGERVRRVPRQHYGMLSYEGIKPRDAPPDAPVRWHDPYISVDFGHQGRRIRLSTGTDRAYVGKGDEPKRWHLYPHAQAIDYDQAVKTYTVSPPVQYASSAMLQRAAVTAGGRNQIIYPVTTEVYGDTLGSWAYKAPGYVARLDAPFRLATGDSTAGVVAELTTQLRITGQGKKTRLEWYRNDSWQPVPGPKQGKPDDPPDPWSHRIAHVAAVSLAGPHPAKRLMSYSPAVVVTAISEPEILRGEMSSVGVRHVRLSDDAVKRIWPSGNIDALRGVFGVGDTKALANLAEPERQRLYDDMTRSFASWVYGEDLSKADIDRIRERLWFEEPVLLEVPKDIYAGMGEVLGTLTPYILVEAIDGKSYRFIELVMPTKAQAAELSELFTHQHNLMKTIYTTLRDMPATASEVEKLEAVRTLWAQAQEVGERINKLYTDVLRSASPFNERALDVMPYIADVAIRTGDGAVPDLRLMQELVAKVPGEQGEILGELLNTARQAVKSGVPGQLLLRSYGRLQGQSMPAYSMSTPEKIADDIEAFMPESLRPLRDRSIGTGSIPASERLKPGTAIPQNPAELGATIGRAIARDIHSTGEALPDVILDLQAHVHGVSKDAAAEAAAVDGVIRGMSEELQGSRYVSLAYNREAILGAPSLGTRPLGKGTVSDFAERVEPLKRMLAYLRPDMLSQLSFRDQWLLGYFLGAQLSTEPVFSGVIRVSLPGDRFAERRVNYNLVDLLFQGKTVRLLWDDSQVYVADGFQAYLATLVHHAERLQLDKADLIRTDEAGRTVLDELANRLKQTARANVDHLLQSQSERYQHLLRSLLHDVDEQTASDIVNRAVVEGLRDDPEKLVASLKGADKDLIAALREDQMLSARRDVYYEMRKLLGGSAESERVGTSVINIGLEREAARQIRQYIPVPEEAVVDVTDIHYALDEELTALERTGRRLELVYRTLDDLGAKERFAEAMTRLQSIPQDQRGAKVMEILRRYDIPAGVVRDPAKLAELAGRYGLPESIVSQIGRNPRVYEAVRSMLNGIYMSSLNALIGQIIGVPSRQAARNKLGDVGRAMAAELRDQAVISSSAYAKSPERAIARLVANIALDDWRLEKKMTGQFRVGDVIAEPDQSTRKLMTMLARGLMQEADRIGITERQLRELLPAQWEYIPPSQNEIAMLKRVADEAEKARRVIALQFPSNRHARLWFGSTEVETAIDGIRPSSYRVTAKQWLKALEDPRIGEFRRALKAWYKKSSHRLRSIDKQSSVSQFLTGLDIELQYRSLLRRAPVRLPMPDDIHSQIATHLAGKADLVQAIEAVFTYVAQAHVLRRQSAEDAIGVILPRSKQVREALARDYTNAVRTRRDQAVTHVRRGIATLISSYDDIARGIAEGTATRAALAVGRLADAEAGALATQALVQLARAARGPDVLTRVLDTAASIIRGTAEPGGVKVGVPEADAAAVAQLQEILSNLHLDPSTAKPLEDAVRRIRKIPDRKQFGVDRLPPKDAPVEEMIKWLHGMRRWMKAVVGALGDAPEAAPLRRHIEFLDRYDDLIQQWARRSQEQRSLDMGALRDAIMAHLRRYPDLLRPEIRNEERLKRAAYNLAEEAIRNLDPNATVHFHLLGPDDVAEIVADEINAQFLRITQGGDVEPEAVEEIRRLLLGLDPSSAPPKKPPPPPGLGFSASGGGWDDDSYEAFVNAVARYVKDWVAQESSIYGYTDVGRHHQEAVRLYAIAGTIGNRVAEAQGISREARTARAESWRRLAEDVDFVAAYSEDGTYVGIKTKTPEGEIREWKDLTQEERKLAGKRFAELTETIQRNEKVARIFRRMEQGLVKEAKAAAERAEALGIKEPGTKLRVSVLEVMLRHTNYGRRPIYDPEVIQAINDELRPYYGDYALERALSTLTPGELDEVISGRFAGGIGIWVHLPGRRPKWHVIIDEPTWLRITAKTRMIAERIPIIKQMLAVYMAARRAIAPFAQLRSDIAVERMMLGLDMEGASIDALWLAQGFHRMVASNRRLTAMFDEAIKEMPRWMLRRGEEAKRLRDLTMRYIRLRSLLQLDILPSEIRRQHAEALDHLLAEAGKDAEEVRKAGDLIINSARSMHEEAQRYLPPLVYDKITDPFLWLGTRAVEGTDVGDYFMSAQAARRVQPYRYVFSAERLVQLGDNPLELFQIYYRRLLRDVQDQVALAHLMDFARYKGSSVLLWDRWVMPSGQIREAHTFGQLLDNEGARMAGVAGFLRNWYVDPMYEDYIRLFIRDFRMGRLADLIGRFHAIWGRYILFWFPGWWMRNIGSNMQLVAKTPTYRLRFHWLMKDLVALFEANRQRGWAEDRRLLEIMRDWQIVPDNFGHIAPNTYIGSWAQLSTEADLGRFSKMDFWAKFNASMGSFTEAIFRAALTRRYVIESMQNVRLRRMTDQQALQEFLRLMDEDPVAAANILQSGRSHVAAVMYDYDDLTPTERKLRRFVAPFYTWYRKNISRQASEFAKNWRAWVRLAKMPTWASWALLGDDQRADANIGYGYAYGLPIYIPFGDKWYQARYDAPERDFLDAMLRFSAAMSDIGVSDEEVLRRGGMVRPSAGDALRAQLDDLVQTPLKSLVELTFGQELRTGRSLEGWTPIQLFGRDIPGLPKRVMGQGEEPVSALPSRIAHPLFQLTPGAGRLESIMRSRSVREALLRGSSLATGITLSEVRPADIAERRKRAIREARAALNKRRRSKGLPPIRWSTRLPGGRRVRQGISMRRRGGMRLGIGPRPSVGIRGRGPGTRVRVERGRGQLLRRQPMPRTRTRVATARTQQGRRLRVYVRARRYRGSSQPRYQPEYVRSRGTAGGRE